jgi:hypothetical protein
MNQLWLVKLKADSGLGLVTMTGLLRAPAESRARTILGMLIDENNIDSKRKNTFYDYLIDKLELFNEEIHGPQHLYGFIDEYFNH